MLNGLTLGGIYGLVALGLTLVYGILHVPNFAHGAFYMVGAFVSFHAMTAWGFNYWVAMGVSALAVAALSVFLDGAMLANLSSVRIIPSNSYSMSFINFS